MSSCEIIEGITLHHGDCRDIMREMPADHFDAVITDPVLMHLLVLGVF